MPTVLRHLFQPILGEIFEEFLGVGQHEVGHINTFWGRVTPLALDLLDEPTLDGLHPRPSDAPPGATAADALLVAAFEETVTDLGRLLGRNQAKWRWGALNQVTWRHPLSAVKALAPILNRGPYELAGDLDTVNYAATHPYPPAGRRATHAWIPAYRLIVDLADPTRSVSLLAGGEWGQPGSPHYADQIGAWRSGRFHALMYNRVAIDKAAIHRLLLVPRGADPRGGAGG